MASKTSNSTAKVKAHLIETGGRLAQSFGFNRVAGQVLFSLYLTDGMSSLDVLEGELRLSKAAVSLACTQLERLGLIRRERREGDRKRYYRSADDIGTALRHGIVKFARAKVADFEMDLNRADDLLKIAGNEPDVKFLAGRLARMHQLNGRGGQLLDNPLLKLFARLGSSHA